MEERKQDTEIEQVLDELQRGAVDFVSRGELALKLARAKKEGRPLRIKLGADPSAPDIHIGHAVVIRKLREFQDLGHEVYFIIGDFTGRIGDPSGKSKTRPQLTEAEIRANAETYREQIFKIMDPDKTHVVFNNDWLGKLLFADVIRLAASYTVARMLERDEFERRFTKEEAISVHEFMYPLAQAYDSVHLNIDVELGGTDQLFNFLATRDIQRAYGQEPQVAMTFPLLEGTDGVQKMSKSLGNYIGISEPPDEIYGKAMSIPDEVIVRYLKLATPVTLSKIAGIERSMASGEMNPRDAKMFLASELVTLYHSSQDAEEAEGRFKQLFQKRETPDDMPPLEVSPSAASEGIWVVSLITEAGFAQSNSEARRLADQGAVRINGEQLTDPTLDVKVSDGDVLQVGKRRFARIKIR